MAWTNGHIPYRPPLRIPLGFQRRMMMKGWPEFKCHLTSGFLICRGRVQPTPLNAVYRVRIEYRLGEHPKVWVEEPALVPRVEGGRIPHVYPGPRPCLFYPPNREWRPDRLLATSILPWLLLWLFHYESWIVTGSWEGGGVHLSETAPDFHEAR
jgi:hypothetical protein